MKKQVFTIGLLAAAPLAGLAQADTFQLDVTADGDSRFFDMFSAAFAQIDKGHSGVPKNDGYFSVAAETNTLISGFTQLNIGNEAAFDAFSPTNFSEFGGVDLFPTETDFSGLGTIEYDAGTGNITDFSMDVYPFVTDDFSQLSSFTGAYTTTISNEAGTVTLVSGGVESINLTADVIFTYGGIVSYNGVVSINGDEFDLFVDEEPLVPNPVDSSQFFPFRLAWDIEGQVNNLVPEPGSALGFAIAGALVLVRRRRGAIR
ncbi:MAG: PEP-CTERM sorting domain-containing protein [Planctomycetota bacterium]